MRGDAPATVTAAIERCERPTLVFDHARLAANLATIARGAKAAGITALFAAKSFPRREVWELAREALDGFDVASPGEIDGVPDARIVSIADPSGRASAATARCERLIVSCETAAQVEGAPARAEIAIRISASLVGKDPAIGAVLDGSGHRRSRFGLDTDVAPRRDALREMARAAAGRPVGLHVHHGPVTATNGERFVATARAVLAAAAEADLVPAFVNLGGAWHGIADVGRAFAAVRSAVPRDIEIIVEPGRAAADGAGFACGRVVVARELADRPLRVTDLSRICHLRWSQVELVGTATRGGTTLFVGPTCYEDDVIGEWASAPSVGERVVLRNVSGYAVAWNVAFGGVPPADVVFTE